MVRNFNGSHISTALVVYGEPGYGGVGVGGFLINISETDPSGLQIFVLKNSRKQVSMASLIVKNHISRTWRCLRCRDIVGVRRSPTDFTETHLSDVQILDLLQFAAKNFKK